MKTYRILNRLMSRRLLIWLITLFLIVGFSGSLLAIFWLVRMRVSYPVEINVTPRAEAVKSHPDNLVLQTVIPSIPFQVIRPGDPADIRLAAGLRINGTVEEVKIGGDVVLLTVAIERISGDDAAERPLSDLHPDQNLKGELTLRSVRLIAAFARRPLRLGGKPD